MFGARALLFYMIYLYVFHSTFQNPLRDEINSGSDSDVSIFQEPSSGKKNADCMASGGGRKRGGLMMPMMSPYMGGGSGGQSPITIINNNGAPSGAIMATTAASTARLRRRPASNQSARIIRVNG